MEYTEQVDKAFKLMSHLKFKADELQKNYELKLSKQDKNISESEFSLYIDLFGDIKNELSELNDEFKNNYKNY